MPIEKKPGLFHISPSSFSLCTYFLCRRLQETFPVKVISSKPFSASLSPTPPPPRIGQDSRHGHYREQPRGGSQGQHIRNEGPHFQPRRATLVTSYAEFRCVSSRIMKFPVIHGPLFKSTFRSLGIKSGKNIMNCGKKGNLGINVNGGVLWAHGNLSLTNHCDYF